MSSVLSAFVVWLLASVPFALFIGWVCILNQRSLDENAAPILPLVPPIPTARGTSDTSARSMSTRSGRTCKLSMRKPEMWAIVHLVYDLTPATADGLTDSELAHVRRQSNGARRRLRSL
jgi:hypothetical protein